MKKYFAIIVATSFFSCFVFAENGPELFTKYSCTGCHSVKAAKIVKVTSKENTEEKDDGTPKIDPPDLSTVGKERTAEWMGKYLMKKEKIKDIAHKKKFQGTPEERNILTEWLATLK